MKQKILQFVTSSMVVLIGLAVFWIAGTPQVTSGISIQGAGCDCNGAGPKRCDEIFTTQSCKGQSDDVNRCTDSGAKTSSCTSDKTFPCGNHCGTADIQECDGCC